MDRFVSLPVDRQFSLAYLLGEISLIAIALAAGRLALHPPAIWMEAQAILFCIALVAGCGAIGGLCLRMTVGLIAGGVFAVACIPLVWLVISAVTL
jgi:hypothetical protein